MALSPSAEYWWPMVNFAHQLEHHAHRKWMSQYLQYDQLKKRIKTALQEDLPANTGVQRSPRQYVITVWNRPLLTMFSGTVPRQKAYFNLYSPDCLTHEQKACVKVRKHAMGAPLFSRTCSRSVYQGIGSCM